MEKANKRIAKNTLFMYVRLLTTMVVGLYVSRLALEILGVSDYGLFAVVGGVLALFTFISNSLSSATSRFFNTEMGKAGGDVNASFNINLLLHLCLALIIFVLAETVGLWYVNHRLNVAPGKLPDALFVYHISMLTACLGIVNGPYQSLFAAHERFRFMAVLDIVNSLVRLGCILMLCLYEGSYALRIYSVIFSLTTVNTFVVYHYVAHRRWPAIIRRRFVRGWPRYREVLGFGGWNVLATLAYMVRSSGSDLLLNSFFGTAMNGAFAISRTVNQSIMSFTGSFDSASAPQIIQSYAAGDNGRCTYLCNKIGRINILMFELICFPLLVELDFVMQLWLGKVPEGAYMLTLLNVLVGGMSLTCGGIFNLINATGRIRWFKLNTSVCFIACIPIGYVLFREGYPAYSILVLFLVADVVQRGVQLYLMHRLLGFDAWLYAREAYGRPLVIALMAGVGFYLHSLMGIESVAGKLASISVCAALTVELIYAIGLTHDERQALKRFVGNARKRLHHHS